MALCRTSLRFQACGHEHLPRYNNVANLLFDPEQNLPAYPRQTYFPWELFQSTFFRQLSLRQCLPDSTLLGIPSQVIGKKEKETKQRRRESRCRSHCRTSHSFSMKRSRRIVWDICRGVTWCPLASEEPSRRAVYEESNRWLLHSSVSNWSVQHCV